MNSNQGVLRRLLGGAIPTKLPPGEVTRAEPVYRRPSRLRRKLKAVRRDMLASQAYVICVLARKPAHVRRLLKGEIAARTAKRVAADRRTRKR